MMMANDLIKSKWKTWFKATDICDCRKITRAEIKQPENKSSELAHFQAQKKNDIIGDMDLLWDIDETYAKNSEEVIEMNGNEDNTDKEILEMQKRLLEVIEVSGGCFKLEEEHKNVPTSLGNANAVQDKKCFDGNNSMDQQNLSCVMLDSLVQFTSCSHRSERVIVNAFRQAFRVISVK